MPVKLSSKDAEFLNELLFQFPEHVCQEAFVTGSVVHKICANGSPATHLYTILARDSIFLELQKIQKIIFVTYLRIVCSISLEFYISVFFEVF